ncbi:MAG TPA: glycosyl hydrolase [Chitinophagaceae bacterium]|nr:glycosyl hydrolase [Chitinophagaceae bacterium]
MKIFPARTIPLFHLKFFLSFSTILLLAVSLEAQVSWPKFNQHTKPWSRWWWMGNAVDEKGISYQLNKMADVGFGGVEVVPIYGAIGFEDRYIKYLSPQWMNALDYTIQKAASFKMGVDMSIGTGWPIGGPQVTMPDAATKLSVQKYLIEAGGTLKEKIVLNDAKQKNLPGVFLTAAIAYDKNGKAINITDSVTADGTLKWTADSSGPWQVVAAFNTKTLQEVKRAAPGGEGLVLDHFSASAVKNYFRTFDSAFAASSHGITAFFNDSYEVFGANWTPDFFKEFKKRRGYELKPFLQELLSNDSSEIVSRVKCDYRQTMSDLMLENFTQNLFKWAHSKNTKIIDQAHGSPGNLLDLYAAADQPESETFGSSSFAIMGLTRNSADNQNVDPDPVFLKFASSAAHAANKPYTSCETFTWLTEHFKTSWSRCKPEVEQVFLSGINHVFYHGSTYSPENVSFPGWLFYASVNFVPDNSLWPHLKGLNEYITRCQSVLQAGQPDNEIKAYWPVFDEWSTSKGLEMTFRVHDIDTWLQPTTFYKNVVYLQHKGFSIDFVSDKMIADQLNINSQKPGPQPRVYLISKCRLMPLSTLKNLIALAAHGNIVVMQALPADVPGLFQLNEQRKEFNRIIESLSFHNVNDDINEFRTGRGMIILSSDLQKGLEYAGLKRETCTDLGLKFIRRSLSDGKYYYIVNHTAQSIDTTITLETSSRSIAIMDPQTGVIGLAKSTSDSCASNVKIKLRSGEALILRTFFKKQNLPAWNYVHATNERIELNKNWNLHFITGGPVLPPDKKLISLQNWTSLNDSSYNYFSGTGAYSTTFFLEHKNADDYLLDLGKVNESARIIINGKDAGIIWSIPFTMNIGQYLRTGKNTITIEVANLMANRIRYMDQHKIIWRKFHDINFVNSAYKDFDASGWDVQPSGLEGPVSITALQKD